MPKTITLPDSGKSCTIRGLTRPERREYMAEEKRLRAALPAVPGPMRILQAPEGQTKEQAQAEWDAKVEAAQEARAVAELDMAEQLQDWVFAKLGLEVDTTITPNGDLNRLFAEIMGRTIGAPEAEVKNS